jgi:hypothetical protein
MQSNDEIVPRYIAPRHTLSVAVAKSSLRTIQLSLLLPASLPSLQVSCKLEFSIRPFVPLAGNCSDSPKVSESETKV